LKENFPGFNIQVNGAQRRSFFSRPKSTFKQLQKTPYDPSEE